MPKEIISATVDKDTASDIRTFASNNDRTFSNAVNFLLKKAFQFIKKEKKKN